MPIPLAEPFRTDTRVGAVEADADRERVWSNEDGGNLGCFFDLILLLSSIFFPEPTSSPSTPSRLPILLFEVSPGALMTELFCRGAIGAAAGAVAEGITIFVGGPRPLSLLYTYERTL